MWVDVLASFFFSLSHILVLVFTVTLKLILFHLPFTNIRIHIQFQKHLFGKVNYTHVLEITFICTLYISRLYFFLLLWIVAMRASMSVCMHICWMPCELCNLHKIYRVIWWNCFSNKYESCALWKTCAHFHLGKRNDRHCHRRLSSLLVVVVIVRRN